MAFGTVKFALLVDVFQIVRGRQADAEILPARTFAY